MIPPVFGGRALVTVNRGIDLFCNAIKESLAGDSFNGGPKKSICLVDLRQRPLVGKHGSLAKFQNAHQYTRPDHSSPPGVPHLFSAVPALPARCNKIAPGKRGQTDDGQDQRQNYEQTHNATFQVATPAIAT
jgi:hypothetical protein